MALDKYFGFSEKEPGIHVSAITVDKIRDFIRARQKEEIGNAAINRSLALLRRMFNIARVDGKIQFMPVVRLLKEPPARKGFLERSQFDKLLSMLPAHLRPLVTLLYYCGVRVGEATQIEWKQVDLQAGLIRVEVEQTKTSEARVVPLPDVLIELLKRVKVKDGQVFDDTSLRDEWIKTTIAAEMPGLLVHDLENKCAGVAELADAQDLGSCGRKALQVQLLSPAPKYPFQPKIASGQGADPLYDIYSHLQHPQGFAGQASSLLALAGALVSLSPALRAVCDTSCQSSDS